MVIPKLVLVGANLIPEHREPAGDTDAEAAESMLAKRAQQPGRCDRRLDLTEAAAPARVGKGRLARPAGADGDVAVRFVEAEGDTPEPVGCEFLFNASKRAKIGIRTSQA